MHLPEPVQKLRQHLARREDSEHVQALVRIGVIAATVAVLYNASPDSTDDPARFLLARQLTLVAVGTAIAFLVAIFLKPAASVSRRLLGMVHDTALLSALLYVGEGLLAPYAALYTILTVGNGFRYGTRYLYAGTALAAGGFAAVYLASAYWQSQTTLSISIFAMLAVVPIYVGQLLNSLHQARDELRREATLDPLTGFLNRAELERRVEKLFERQPGGHVLMFCDLDHFKMVNDAAGHAAGDRMLVDVARLIEKSVRGTDLCARPGGDEFCVLITDCDLERARAIARHVLTRVSGYRLAWGQRLLSVGISIGVAPSAAVGDMQSLFRLADAACYASKNAGRNQIHVVDPDADVTDTASVRSLGQPETRGNTAWTGVPVEP